jgi:mannose-6-phosphate isomerase
LPVVPGDFIFIPSGRLHAIGGGLVIFEIQQNSDTTYRVFDWNRVGLDGKPRELHVEESLRCIDFTDTNPSVSHADQGTLVSCAFFRTEARTVAAGSEFTIGTGGKFSVLAIVSGVAKSTAGELSVSDHLLVPASVEAAMRQAMAVSDLTYLEIYFV